MPLAWVSCLQISWGQQAAWHQARPSRIGLGGYCSLLRNYFQFWSKYNPKELLNTCLVISLRLQFIGVRGFRVLGFRDLASRELGYRV